MPEFYIPGLLSELKQEVESPGTRDKSNIVRRHLLEFARKHEERHKDEHGQVLELCSWILHQATTVSEI
jgi:hypothetical protein